MIAAEWQILFHSFQGKDIDIQILDGYTEQMPLLPRGIRATAGTPQLWGPGGRESNGETHTEARAKGLQWARFEWARSPGQSPFARSYQSTAVCISTPALSSNVSLFYLGPVWTPMGSGDENWKERWVCAVPKPRGEHLLHRIWDDHRSKRLASSLPPGVWSGHIKMERLMKKKSPIKTF